MTDHDWDAKAHWDARYSQGDVRQEPARVLTDHLYLLPSGGKALDLACGLGANALLLARQGLSVWGWDISAVAVRRLSDAAWEENLDVTAERRDLSVEHPEADRFDVIVVSRFLERDLAPHIVAALRPGGLLFYQTFIRDKATDSGPDNPDFLLADNELLRLFAPLRPRIYREEGRLGDTTRGFRNEAMLVAQKATDGWE